MISLLNIIKYLKKHLFAKVRRLLKKIKRKIKRRIGDVRDILSLNFYNIRKHKKALKRYKRYSRIASAKKNKKDKLSITQAYNTFSYTIIVLVASWTFLNALSIYQSQKEGFEERVEIQKAIIEKNFSNSISLVDNFSSYVGDKILLFGINDKKAIATILKKNNTSDSISRNIYSWLDVDYVTNNKKIIVSSKYGVLPKPENAPNYYPIAQSVKNKWKFKMGKVTPIKSAYGDYEIIPVAFSIDDDNYNPRGTLISRIIIQKVEDDINLGIEDDDVSYVVLDRDFKFIAYSRNNKILTEEKKKNLIEYTLSVNKELKKIFADFEEFSVASKDGKLGAPINIGNISYQSYRQSDYPFIILTSYSREVVWQSFKEKLGYVLFQSFAITLLFLSALFIFKRIQIVPIIRQLIDSREKAEEASKAKSDFLSTISHELRTPMNGIIGMSQILSESKNLDDEDWDQIKTINKSANALLLILNDILNFSKIEAQKVELENIDFNLNMLVENTIDIMSPTAIKKGLEIFMHTDKELPRIFIGDPGRLRQILTNLINNAIKFTDQGQIVVEILLEKKIKDKYFLRFNIKDSGIGIKKSDLGNLFRKFTQADMSTTRKYGGTGLGLSICKELVKLMNGKIGIESKFGSGSNFWFNIALEKSENDLEPVRIEERQQVKNKNMLLINSNVIGRNIQKYHIQNLFEIGFDILDLPNLDQFTGKDFDLIVNKIPKDKYDSIVISNCRAKNFHGVDIAKRIKKIDVLSDVPLILAISSFEKAKLLEKDIKLFSSIMIKPLKEAPLIETFLDVYKVKYQKNKRTLVDNNSTKFNKSKIKTYRILMCEDNQINMKVAATIINRIGYKVDLAENGEEGLKKIFDENTKYDLIFMDCMMPIMDGFTATKKIRKEEIERNLERTPIIALTANISTSDQEKCFKSGMDDFLSKPIKKEQLAEIIEKWINKDVVAKNNS